MPVIRIESLDDERVQPFSDLRERELARDGQRFITEGEFILRRLLESDFEVESLLLTTRRAESIAPLVPDDVPIFVADDELIKGVVGYKFHSGILACGRRKPTLTLDEVVSPDGRDTARPLTLAVCPDTNQLDNLGAIIRIAAGFGVDGLLLGEQCCDPFWRRSVRVSMGTVFKLPIRQSEHLETDLRLLRGDWQVTTVASVCSGPAEPLQSFQRPHRLALLLGSEGHGLSQHWLNFCDRRVTIPMRLGTDSLNVAIAAAVLLYQLTSGSAS